jgi:hypothetical protein
MYQNRIPLRLGRLKNTEEEKGKRKREEEQEKRGKWCAMRGIILKDPVRTAQ